MIRRKPKYALPLILVCQFLLTDLSPAEAATIVFDRVTTVGTSVYLKVLTKGRLFSQGGKRVTFYLDGKPLGKTLTGGDGYGYLKYTPERKGIQNIEVRADEDKGSGRILVLAKDEKAIVLEIEGSLKPSLYSEDIRSEGREAVSTLIRSHKIIYLNRFFDTGLSKKWLEKEKFPPSVIMRWRGSGSFAYLREQGVNLWVFIGSAALISASTEYFEKSYTFEETEKGKKVDDWSEVVKLLLDDEKK
jgi:hypothetical protein